MKKILIDTDIGDDIDDALAIAYALNSKSIEVVGITTAFRNVEARSQLVMQQLSIFGHSHIPVSKGIGKPFIEPVNVEDTPKYKDLTLTKNELNCSMHAVDFIIESVKRYPDLIIAALAPLTNIACAIRKAPEIMCNADIWMMGGMYTEAYPEWNIQCDPEAAAIVLEGCRNVKMVGLDVTLRCRMTQQQVDALCNTGSDESQFLYKWIKMWMDTSGHLPILHDPLVMASIENPKIISLEPKQIMVECAGNYSRGITIEKTDPFQCGTQSPNVLMAVDVDADTFMRMFLSTVFPC